jgi:two-component system sensor histidine kinase YesM
MKEEVGKTMQQLVKQNHATLAKTLSSVRDRTITFLDNQFFSSAKQYEFWTGIDTLSIRSAS